MRMNRTVAIIAILMSLCLITPALAQNWQSSSDLNGSINTNNNSQNGEALS